MPEAAVLQKEFKKFVVAVLLFSVNFTAAASAVSFRLAALPRQTAKTPKVAPAADLG